MFDRSEVIGFRLKGFKNFYLRTIKPGRGLNHDFLSLAVALEKAIDLVAENIIKFDGAREAARKEAYECAYRMATEDGVALRDSDLPRRRA